MSIARTRRILSSVLYSDKPLNGEGANLVFRSGPREVGVANFAPLGGDHSFAMGLNEKDFANGFRLAFSSAVSMAAAEPAPHRLLRQKKLLAM